MLSLEQANGFHCHTSQQVGRANDQNGVAVIEPVIERIVYCNISIVSAFVGRNNDNNNDDDDPIRTNHTQMSFAAHMTAYWFSAATL